MLYTVWIKFYRENEKLQNKVNGLYVYHIFLINLHVNAHISQKIKLKKKHLQQCKEIKQHICNKEHICRN